jgi:nucleoside-diphosphate-sugar epimerase
VFGGTRYVCRHTVRESLDRGDDDTTLSRDRHGVRFGGESPVEQLTVDRTDVDAIADVAQRVDLNAVIDVF